MAYRLEAGKVVKPEIKAGTIADVVVVGGGPAGVYLAGELQKKYGGKKDSVILLEQQDHLGGSALASLMQFRTLQGDPALARLVNSTVQRYREVSEELYPGTGERGKEGGLIDPFPYLFLARTEAELEQHARNLANVQAGGFGLDAEMLGPDELRSRFPFIDGDLAGALIYPDAGRLDFEAMIQHIVKTSPNVTFALETQMGRIDVKKGRVVGVETSQGYIATDKVVLAPGPFLLNADDQIVGGKLLEDGDINEIVTVQKRQRFTAGVSGLPANTKVYVIADGAYVRLATGEDGTGEGLYGFADDNDPKLRKDQIVTNPIADEAEFPAIVYSMLGGAMSGYGTADRSGRLARIPNSRSAGYYVDRKDEHPTISKVPGIEGLYLDGTYTHMGVMTGLGGAEIMAGLVTEEKTPGGIILPSQRRRRAQALEEKQELNANYGLNRDDSTHSGIKL